MANGMALQLKLEKQLAQKYNLAKIPNGYICRCLPPKKMNNLCQHFVFKQCTSFYCRVICDLNQNQSMQGDEGMPISTPQLQSELAHLIERILVVKVR